MEDQTNYQKTFENPPSPNNINSKTGQESKPAAPPHSLVWTPIPVITWLLPFVGHMGITTSHGNIYDFAAPYHVTVDDMAFGGNPIKYYPIKLEKGEERKVWDEAICSASREYNDYHVHNLFIDNCHSHVALCLNTYISSSPLSSVPKELKSKGRWNVSKLAFLMFIHGRYITWRGFS